MAPFFLDFFARSFDPCVRGTIVVWYVVSHADRCLTNSGSQMNFKRMCWLLCFVLLNQGCSIHPPHPHALKPVATSQVPAGNLDFGWKLSGDRDIAPLQVFSDDMHTWVQWQPHQGLPAITASSTEGEHVLSYKRQDPYTIIEGHWSKLSFRAGRRQAFARRVQAGVSEAPAVLAADRSRFPDRQERSAEIARQTSRSDKSKAAPEIQTASVMFAVTPDDQHLRQALTRWSGLSGWRFQPEHWSVDVDIPLSGGASFSDDFVSSVQALVLSTEMSDRPLQPCFYSNQVLRIVSAAEPCDRTAIPGARI